MTGILNLMIAIVLRTSKWVLTVERCQFYTMIKFVVKEINAKVDLLCVV